MRHFSLDNARAPLVKFRPTDRHKSGRRYTCSAERDNSITISTPSRRRRSPVTWLFVRARAPVYAAGRGPLGGGQIYGPSRRDRGGNKSAIDFSSSMHPFGVNYFVLAVWGDKSAAAFSLSAYPSRSLLQLFLWRCAKNCLRVPAFAYIVFFTLSLCQWIRVGGAAVLWAPPFSVCVDRMLKCGVQAATLLALGSTQAM
jgi:hypothetical protein